MNSDPNSWGSGPADGSGDAWTHPLATLELGKRYGEGLLIGEGGMGTVHSVTDEALGRLVARKVVREPSPGAEARLLREARITASLDHPGVVPVHDVGRLDDGRLFYTMRLVSGRTLAQTHREATVPQVCRHLLDATRTIAYAHSQGVLHRDLKPSNVLVGRFGETQVADWGLAVRIEDSTPGPVGTPGYMAPEAEAGERCDRRSDVYSLGATLSAVAPPGDAELEAIAARATASDPNDRYSDAAALAADLEAWLDGRRVAAYAYSTTELLRRTAWAWRVPLSVVGLMGLTVVGASVWVAVRTSAERDRAVAAEGVANQAKRLAERSEAAALLERAIDALAHDDRPTAELQAIRSLKLDPSARAWGVLASWHGVPRPEVLDKAPLDCDRSSLTGSAVVCYRGAQATLGDLELDAHRLERLEDGSVLAWRPRDELERIDAQGRVLASAHLFSGPISVRGLRALRVGQGRYYVVDLADGSMERLFPCEKRPQVGTFGLDGSLWAVCSDGRVRQQRTNRFEDVGRIAPGLGLASTTTDTADGLLIGTLHGYLLRNERVLELFDGSIRQISVSPDAARAVVLRENGSAALVDLVGWQLLTRLPGPYDDVAWLSADRLRTVGTERRDWRLPPTRPVRFSGGEGVATVALGRERIAVGRGDGTLVVRDRTTGRETHRSDRYLGVLKHAVFGPDDRLLFHGHQPHEVGVLDGDQLHAWPTRASLRVFWQGDAIGWVPYGTGIHWGPIGDEPQVLPTHRFVDLDEGGTGLTLLGRFGQLFSLDAGGLVAGPEVVGAHAVSVDGETLWFARDATVQRLNGEPWTFSDSRPLDLAAEGGWLAVGMLDGEVHVRRADGTELVLPGHRNRIAALDLEGSTLLSGSWDGMARTWDLSVIDSDPVELAGAIEAAWGH